MQRIASTRQAGFTMIELVMVIVIIGILAAFALPRFADLGTDARRASLQGAFGAIQSASGIAHSKALASANAGNITLEGQAITMVNSYPTADVAGIITAAGIDTASANAKFAVLAAGGAAAGSTVTINLVGATTAANCSISYVSPGAGNAPNITMVTTGC